ncbi:MAG: Epoxyqueuosine reductase [Methanoregulaceae archaeon PtaU1.Bin059]|nr:MAG: Epoxyqueuosine reductase [Methanoregulaceae archaeon PtaB.Bin152]OPY41351.1 MAG: Epoxyqueuosine reductase [Methanoregulaceae archaeon PtaU1.Bin059]
MADAGTSPTDREDIARFFRDHDIEEYAVVSSSTLHAPVGRRPGDLIPSAQTVILFGAETDEHVFSGTNDEISLKVRAFLNKIRRVEDDLCSALQSEGFEARAVRSVILQEGTIKGMLSLTHCAADAGLGVIGDNRLLISPRFGSRIGLGAGVTIKKMEETLRPESSIEGCNHCNNCIRACPEHALAQGTLDIFFLQERDRLCAGIHAPCRIPLHQIRRMVPFVTPDSKFPREPNGQRLRRLPGILSQVSRGRFRPGRSTWRQTNGGIN